MVLKNWEGAVSSLAHTGLMLASVTRNKKLDWIWQAWKSIIIFVLKMLFTGKKDEVRDKTESRK